MHKKYDCLFIGKPPLSIEQALFGIAVLVTRKVSPGFPIELLRPIHVSHFSQPLRVDGTRSAVGLNLQHSGSVGMMDADQVAEAVLRSGPLFDAGHPTVVHFDPKGPLRQRFCE